MKDKRTQNPYPWSNNNSTDLGKRWFMIIIAVLVILSVISRTAAAWNNSRTVAPDASADPTGSQMWTPIPDEELAMLGRKDSEEKNADLSAYGIENSNVIEMSQSALVEYLSEDNDFDGMILITKPDCELCSLVMQPYSDAADSAKNLKFYSVSLEESQYTEAVRSVLAGTLEKDSTGRPKLLLPLVLAVRGDQVLDYQEGLIPASSISQNELTAEQSAALKDRYLELADEIRHPK